VFGTVEAATGFFLDKLILLFVVCCEDEDEGEGDVIDCVDEDEGVAI